MGRGQHVSVSVSKCACVPCAPRSGSKCVSLCVRAHVCVCVCARAFILVACVRGCAWAWGVSRACCGDFDSTPHGKSLRQPDGMNFAADHPPAPPTTLPLLTRQHRDTMRVIECMYRSDPKVFTRELNNYGPEGQRPGNFWSSQTRLAARNPFAYGRKWPAPTGRPGSGASLAGGRKAAQRAQQPSPAALPG